MFFNFLIIWNCFFASLVILNRNSLYSIISLIFVITGSCFMLFSLEIEFLAFILMLIYIGAISILFLFIIMMLKLNKEEIHKNLYFALSSKYYIYILILLKIILFLFHFNKKLSLSLDNFSYEFLKYNDDLNIFSTKLFQIENDILIFFNIFTQKYLFFLIVGFILLFSMIGSISLCLKKKSLSNVN